MKGIPAAPGIALGPAFVHSVRHEQPPIRHLASLPKSKPSSHALQNPSRWCVRSSALEGRLWGTVSSALGKIFDAQVMIVDDAAIVAQVMGFIERERIGAENAYSRVLTEAQQSIARASDPYLREMVNDIEAVKTRVVNCLLGLGASLNTPLSSPVILFADNITPSDIIGLKRDCVLGIVTEGGGQTSHTALLASRCAFPRLSGSVLMYGWCDRAVWWRLTDTMASSSWSRIRRRSNSSSGSANGRWRRGQRNSRCFVSCRPRLLTSTASGLMANIDLGREATSVAEAGADGVGLYRTEYLFPRTRASTVGEYATRHVSRGGSRHSEAGRWWSGRFDLGSDKAIPGRSPEPNPALGLRGLRLSLRYPRLCWRSSGHCCRCQRLAPSG